MSSPESSINNFWRIVGVPVAAFALAACAASREEIIEGLSPIERIDYEYGGGVASVDGDAYSGENTCLLNTAYDPITSRAAADFAVSRDESGRLLVTLTAAGNEGVISLRGFEDNSQPLQPADEASRLKMSALGCIDT